jgi:hypothetical protein
MTAFTWNRSFSQSAACLALNIDWGALRLKPSGEAGLSIEMESDAPLEENFAVKVVESDDEIALQVLKTRTRILSRGPSLSVTVAIPEGMEVSASVRVGSIEDRVLAVSLRLKIEVGNLDLGELSNLVQAVTQWGDIHANQLSGSTTLKTATGSIQAKEISSSLNVECGVGGIRILDAACAINASCMQDTMEVCYAAGDRSPGDFRLDAGQLALWLDPAISREIRYDLGVASVRSSLPESVHANAPAQRLSVSMKAGEVILHPLTASANESTGISKEDQVA